MNSLCNRWYGYTRGVTALLLLCFSVNGQNICTVAGTGTAGYNGDSLAATTSRLNQATGVTVDKSGNILIADSYNNRIRKISQSGIITTIAGNGIAGYSGDNSKAELAELNYPYAIIVDSSGNIYFSDMGNSRIRKIDTLGVITTIAGNGGDAYNGDNIPATTAQCRPGGLGIAKHGGLCFGDFVNNRIRLVDSSGIITTIAGTGYNGYNGDNIVATTAMLSYPIGVSTDNSGNIFIADTHNSRIRKIDSFGIITTIAGNGVEGYNADSILATDAKLDLPAGVTTDGLGNICWSDWGSGRVRKLNTSGMITTLAGDGMQGYGGDNGMAVSAELNYPVSLSFSPSGDLYIADEHNSRIRKISYSLQVSTPLCFENIVIYPNPTTGKFTIKLPNMVSGNLIVCNTIGVTLVNTKIDNTYSQVDISNQANGVYFVNLKTNKDSYVYKVIVAK